MVLGWTITQPCTRAEAEAINASDIEFAGYDVPPTLVTAETASGWEVIAYFDHSPAAAAVAAVSQLTASRVAPRIEELPDDDWVRVSQAALKPVQAGRFYVHTAANRGPVPPDAKSFIVEAAQAFGTGGHDTTAACLVILDKLKQAGARFEHIIDIGTGTGLLALAAGHLWPRAYVTASDIDPLSIAAARGNAIANGAVSGQRAGHIALCVAAGTAHELILRRAPYDLVIANILARPLIALAPAITAITRDGGSLILAGLLRAQIESVARAYRREGMRIASIGGSHEWPCLHLRKRTRFGWRRSALTGRGNGHSALDFGTL